MATAAEQKFQEVANTWFDTMHNYYNDMAASETAEQAKAIEDNYHRAERAYLDALEKGLTSGGKEVDAALDALKAANSEVKASRAAVDKIAKILGSAKKATTAATKLVKAAAP